MSAESSSLDGHTQTGPALDLASSSSDTSERVADFSCTIQYGPLIELFAPEIATIDAEWNPRPWGEELFRSECRNQVSASYGAFHGESVIAYLFCHVVIDAAHIVSFGVQKGWRRQGVGAGLLGHGMRAMARQGVRTVTLEVRASNLAARALYERFGFVAAGVRRKYYSDNQEDAITMRSELESL